MNGNIQIWNKMCMEVTMDNVIQFTKAVCEWIFNNTFYINIILGIAIVFFQRRDPVSVWAWLLLLYFIPIVGFVIYLILGQDYHKSRMFRVKEVEDELNGAIKQQENIIFNNEFSISEKSVRDYEDLVLFNLETSGAIYSENNSVKIYTDGDDKFNDLIDDMKRAKKFIHMQYYIINSGELLDRIIKVIEKKVKEGVEVRILYDSMGGRHFNKKDIKRLKRAGVKIGEFFPAYLGIFQLRINYRNHRKIVVIDGEKAYVGGFNVGDEYISRVERFGYWRDTHMKIQGDAVNDLHVRFMLDWNYTTKENLFTDEKYFTFNQKIKSNKLGMQIISSGPDSKRQEIRDNYLRLISKAKERIYIHTPYFMPDEAVLTALKIAALSGIDVRIMIPCKPDHLFVYWATYSYAGDLLESGARCYCYDGGFLHAKGIVVDGLVSCYGTANMDRRSFALNFEVNAVIYDLETSWKLEKEFLNDLTKCSEITKYVYDRRSLWIRVKEQISRLLVPLL